jgi:hypothetical protein
MEPKINKLGLTLVELGFQKTSYYCKEDVRSQVSGCKKKNIAM